MELKGDLASLGEYGAKSFELMGLSLPVSRDVYYRAKQKEILDQYTAARIFMDETETTDWEHWFAKVENANMQKYVELTFRAHFYEIALMYYNIVVDLSWVSCYLAAEFALEARGERVDFGGIKPIEEAYNLLRRAEKLVTNPNAEDNPFVYLKKMCPEFSHAIDMIVDFWNQFVDSSIRQRYNFCKHKGKPAYVEMEQLNKTRFVGFYRENSSGERVKLASNPVDVRFQISLEKAIEELRQFDNEKLFPYISGLFSELERVIKPSPIV